MSITQTLLNLLTLPIWKLILAFLGGLIPIFIWLWFFEHEDKHPEPQSLIILAFAGGIVGVFGALYLEGLVSNYLPNLVLSLYEKTKLEWLLTSYTTISTVLFATIEELIKLSVAYVLVLRNAENDEPIDSVMYLIATALGFAAMETGFFLLSPIIGSNYLEALIVGNFRFIGASLLHVVASTFVGGCIALAFYKGRLAKSGYVAIGLILAVVLHTIFNLFIMNNTVRGVSVAFYIIWAAVVCILLFLEKVKNINRIKSTYGKR
jgi:RsiW-degrading membrane proteinase PrsW (M82 family)